MNFKPVFLDPFRVSLEKPKNKWNQDSQTFQNAVKKIKLELYRRARRMYVGEFSLAAGISIDRVEEVIEYLCENGILKYISLEEKKRLLLPLDAEIVECIEKTKIRPEED